VQFTPVKFVRLDAGWGVEKYEAEPKRSAPLARTNLTMGATTVSGAIDWRRSPGWSNSGGAVRFTWKGRRGIDGDEVSYNEYEGEATELIPILRGNWVIALHGVGTTTDNDEGDVPFFLLPSIGGNTDRGYANFRFRDRHRLATSAELRWSAAQFMDLAVFVDAARVAATRSELDFNDLHTSYGFGARFHTLYSTIFRAEVARGREGLRFTVGGGPVF
jgi:outer membrane translocation and assembly module TamA